MSSDLVIDPTDPTKAVVGHASEALFGFQVGPMTLSNIHPPGKCAGQACMIHNPSDHHMRGWPLNWRDDKRVMERICPHGVGHPDPDSAAFLASVGEQGRTLHGCDGCCEVPA